jgi:uncharacterized protein
MYYALFYKTVENYVERRQPFRELHLAHAQKYKDDGSLVMGGAFGDTADGALIIFEGDERIAKAFAENDPYVINGLITEWKVRKWNVVIQR